MNDRRSEVELKEAFQRLRSEDRAATPDFAELMARVRAWEGEVGREGPRTAARMPQAGGRWRARPRARWLWAGGSLAAAAAAAGLLLLGPRARADREFEETVRAFTAAAGGWRTPTDALLDMPGISILNTVPDIGGLTWPGGPRGDAAGDRS